MKTFWRPCSLVLVLITAACASGGNADDSSAVVDDSVVEDSVVEDSVVEDTVVEDTVVEDTVVEDTVVEDEPVVRAEVKVGAVSSLSGPFAFTDASLAATAVFDRYNADPDGLVTIEYIVEDDAADPAISAQVARKLVGSDNVAMMAGSAGLADCNVNAAFYEENVIYSVPGTGVSDACFTSPNLEPVNAGASLVLTTSLYYMSEVLGRDAICVFRFNAGNPSEPAIAAIDRWTAITGKSLLIHETYAPGEDFTPLVTRAQSEGCDAVFEGGLEFTAIAWDAAVAGQGATFDTFHFPSAYTANAADVIGTAASDTYAVTEFEPFTSADSAALADWLDVMTEADVPLTALAQGGYLAAVIAIEILESAGLTDGDDVETQRTKIGEAVTAFEPFDNALLGRPYVFGSSAAGNLSAGVKFVQLVDGEWVTVTDEFIDVSDFE